MRSENEPRNRTWRYDNSILAKLPTLKVDFQKEVFMFYVVCSEQTVGNVVRGSTRNFLAKTNPIIINDEWTKSLY